MRLIGQPTHDLVVLLRMLVEVVQSSRLARRVIIDGRLRMGDKLHLVATAREIPTFVLTSAKQAGSAKAKRLARKGVEIISCRQRGGRVELDSCLTKLMKLGVTNVLVEGGPTVISAFLERR